MVTDGPTASHRGAPNAEERTQYQGQMRLTPRLLLLRKIKVPRVPAVIIVVTLAFAIIFALGWMLSHQVAQLASDLPRYQHVLAGKISAFRKSAESSGTFDNIAGALKSIEDEISQRAGPVPAGTAASAGLD